MTWTCPSCKRIFRNTNSWHSCIQTDELSHFENKPAKIKEIYDLVKAVIEACGPFTIEPVKHAIMFKQDSSFIVIRPKKSFVEVCFTLEIEVDEFPVYKTLQASKRRWVHFVKIENAEEVDGQFIGWLEASYRLYAS